MSAPAAAALPPKARFQRAKRSAPEDEEDHQPEHHARRAPAAAAAAAARPLPGAAFADSDDDLSDDDVPLRYAPKQAAKRFSLLLLEDEEDYVADWVASCAWPADVEGNWQGAAALPGRLRLATRSLFFEPDDVRVPIVRLEFSAVTQLEACGARACVVGVTKATRMKAGGRDAPYVVDRNKPSAWTFTLTYATLDAFMPLAQEQLVLSRLPATERLALLDAAVKAREDAAAFDTSRLVDFGEAVAWEGPAAQLTPLVREPGRLAVTDQRLYFQPLHNIAGDTPVRVHPLAGVAAVVRRRASLRPVGVEVFLLSRGAELGQALAGPTWDAPSAFFAFRSEADRDAALAALTRQPALGVAASGGWLGRVTAAWRLGRVTNFDYLLYLNLAAGRSFNDLAQWPVFPWVLRDYTSAALDLSSDAAFRDLSRPMGAQSAARLQVFRQRFRDMEALSGHSDPGGGGGAPPPFMYGTHYSTPGYVLFWLVRSAPGHMLRLQAGRFDAPDRLFNSLADAWASATSSTTDVKELIPEFYMPGGDFLVNAAGLALGVRQSGAPVHDVALPPWAASPEDLLAKHRAALEAPAVSRSLHGWIDLIFGCKQRGPAAADADNVFYHLTYEGAVDADKVGSLQELKALETQINEFGQTPAQLFTAPHPPRLVAPPAPDPATVFAPPAPAGGGGGVEGGGGGAAALGGGGSKSRLKGGGEDAAGNAICLALLKSIVAAAAPDIQATQAEPAGSSSASASGGGGPPRSEGSDAAQEEGPGLSPVSSGDCLSAASVAAAAAAPGGAAKAPAGLRSMLGRLTDSASAAAGSAAASVASALQSGSFSSTAGSAAPPPGMGLAGMPVSLGSRGSGSMKASLSWMQQQFAEGLALGGGGAKAAPDAAPADPAVARSPSPAAAASPPPSGAGRHALAGAAARPWPRDLPEGLRPKKSLRLQAEPLTAVAASPEGAVFVTGQDGLLRVLDAGGLATFRSAKLDEEPLCICLLPAAPTAGHGGSPARPGAGGGGGGGGAAGGVSALADAHLPLMLAGCQSGRLLAYAPNAGRLLGSFAAHEDSVSAALPLGAGGGRFATASWDCCVKVWDVAEGRAPWTSTLPLATQELRDVDSGVWALSASASGQLLVTGSDEGTVAAWDLRTRQHIWATQVSAGGDYVGGVSLLPGGNHVAAAAADGSLSLLEWRRAGLRVAGAACGAPLRCCACDGALLIAGAEGGQLALWGLSQLTAATGDDGGGSVSLAAGPDGLYPPISAPSRAAVNGVAVAAGGAAALGGGAVVLAALDDGALVAAPRAPALLHASPRSPRVAPRDLAHSSAAMSLDYQTYADSLTVIRGFCAKADGKDKLTALVQYLCLYLSAGEPGNLKKVQASVTAARKVFRIMRPLESITPLLLQPGLTGKQPVHQEVLQKVKDALMATYFAADHVVWAFQIGLVSSKQTGERAQKVSLWSWALGSVVTMIMEANAILSLSSRRLPGESDAEWARRQDAARADINGRLLVFLHGGLQALTALGLLQLYPFRPRTVGLFGSLASALNCYFLLPAMPKRPAKAGALSAAPAPALGEPKLVAKVA
ncbi:lvsF [Scenedesmus sp. PABB004]|nr:lvsF [Scenedesmus sp. PABB004]